MFWGWKANNRREKEKLLPVSDNCHEVNKEVGWLENELLVVKATFGRVIRKDFEITLKPRPEGWEEVSHVKI